MTLFDFFHEIIVHFFPTSSYKIKLNPISMFFFFFFSSRVFSFVFPRGKDTSGRLNYVQVGVRGLNLD